MLLNLDGKKALVTGGSHGIGLAIREVLESEGVEVFSISRREGVDVLNYEDMVRALLTYTDMDILINNVGGGGRWGTPEPLNTDYKTWQEVYKKNTETAIQFTLSTLPYMIEQKWGRVISIASIFGKEGGGRPWFTTAKAAEIAFMKSMALQHYDGITFNTICPGYIYIEGKPMEVERFGYPEDIAGIVAFLCSDHAKWINGACIMVDGGESKSY
ncbi:MAG: SDR family NAD(P)-dependent oxidoreductase [Candidatus Odinarchaeota archaeon]